MRNGTDVSICLHHFLGDFWWMDGNCFLLVKEYLDKYYPENQELVADFANKVIYVTVKRRDLIKNQELFNVKELGKRALLVSFTYNETGFCNSENSIKFEFIYKENENIKTGKINFTNKIDHYVY